MIVVSSSLRVEVCAPCSLGAGGGWARRAGRQAPSAVRCGTVGWAGAARNRWSGCTGSEKPHEVGGLGGAPSVSGSCLVCVVADGAVSQQRRGGCVRHSVAGGGVVGFADEVPRHPVPGGERDVRGQEHGRCARPRARSRSARGGEGSVRGSAASRRRSSGAGSCAASCGVGVAGDAERPVGAGGALDVPAGCGAFRRPARAGAHARYRLGAVREGAGAVGESARRGGGGTLREGDDAEGSGADRCVEEPGHRPIGAGVPIDRAPGAAEPRPGVDRGGSAALGAAVPAGRPRDRGRRHAPSRRPPHRRGSVRDGRADRARDRHAGPDPQRSRRGRGDRRRPRRARDRAGGRRLRTLDALHTTRETARRVVETQDADGRMTVKGHASKTFETFESLHWETTSTGRYRETPTLEHGRIEPRRIEVFTPPAKMIHDPHVKPIVRVPRRVECKKSGKPTTEHASGRTSVAADRASPQPVLARNRGPWGVERHPPHPRRHLPRRRLQAPGPHRARKPRDPPHPRPCRHPPPPAEAAPALPPLRRRPLSLCRPAQAGPARRHKIRRTARTPRPKPQASEPGHPTRPGLSPAPDPPKRTPRTPLRAATGPQTSAPLTIADSNASTRAAIKTPIASQQQAWDHLGARKRARSVVDDRGPMPVDGYPSVRQPAVVSAESGRRAGTVPDMRGRFPRTRSPQCRGPRACGQCPIPHCPSPAGAAGPG